MPESNEPKNIMDELEIIEDSPKGNKDPKDNKKLARRLMFGAAGLAILAGVGTGVVKHNENVDKNKDDKDKVNDTNTVNERREDPYASLSKTKAAAVKDVNDKMTEAAKKVANPPKSKREEGESIEDIRARLDKQTAEHNAEVNELVTDAMEAIPSIKGDDTETKAIRDIYTEYGDVLSDKFGNDDLARHKAHIQLARSYQEELKDSDLADHIDETVTDNVYKAMGERFGDRTNAESIENDTKPVTASEIPELKKKVEQMDKQVEDEKAAQAAKAASTSAALASEAASMAQHEAEQSAAQSAAQEAQAEAQVEAEHHYDAPAEETYSQEVYQAPAQQAPAQAPAQQAPAQQAPAQQAPANNNAAQSAAQTVTNPPAPATGGPAGWDPTGNGTVGVTPGGADQMVGGDGWEPW